MRTLINHEWRDCNLTQETLQVSDVNHEQWIGFQPIDDELFKLFRLRDTLSNYTDDDDLLHFVLFNRHLIIDYFAVMPPSNGVWSINNDAFAYLQSSEVVIISTPSVNLTINRYSTDYTTVHGSDSIYTTMCITEGIIPILKLVREMMMKVILYTQSQRISTEQPAMNKPT
jgi:hypothetical protein